MKAKDSTGLDLTAPPLGGILPASPSHEVRMKFYHMSEGYCVKCKAKKIIADGVEETMKNGRKAIKGKCPTCGTGMYKILGKSASASPSSTPPAAPPAQA